MSVVIFNSSVPGKQEIKLRRGSYRFECWGASGGRLMTEGSTGAYVSGIISIKTLSSFYLFIGEKGTPRNTSVTFNGGGAASNYESATGDIKASYGSSGGGATDIRLDDGNWDDLNSLKSRIMVAAGGGGETHFASASNANINQAKKGGSGGSIIGENATYSQCYECKLHNYRDAGGGEQQKGGKSGGGSSHGFGNDGSFGRGADANVLKDYWPSSGGGSGYFGGGSGGVSSDCLGAGAGGSSFVSGCKECSAIAENFTNNYPSFNGNVHYSGYAFKEIIMTSGFQYNRISKDGQIIITKLQSLFCKTRKQNSHGLILIYVFILL